MIAAYRKVLAGLPLVFLLVGCVWLVGCASSEPVESESSAPLVRQVTQSAHCGLTGPGLAYVQTSERLQQLLELPTQNMAVQQLRQVDLQQEHLLFVTLGEKPTGGYNVSLASAERAGKILRLSMAIRAPAPGTMVTQAITSPCAVVAVPANEWSEVRVSGVRDKDLVLKL
ncbi:protease complex subunit PrcB family protein [Marinobacter sp. 2_MG-2023]|uniref:protease complex subunit PrcB family protein n=1 Tax=Marinobacter sp. 2_MG-2023 TaxID=3062679 RepID=UPI0026E404A7|nr:protease complex subunit PrcB family protein [Marinobacter sp. 2_MG-2023]MDO6442613.1 protease complex subunit PrcB family protein [Marinobacter sp. 2_MG-2023]